MKEYIKPLISKNIKKKISLIRDIFFDRYFNKSYSQEGEDMVLRRVFNSQETGYYIDIGAHHPKLFSNTYMFYKKGWKGINIDPLPGIMDYFNKIRPRDINLQIGVSEKKQVLTYHMFNEPALNGFSSTLSSQYEQETNYKLLNKVNIETFPLSYILDKYFPQHQAIDFLSIDAEGLDFEVLKSNNWEKYKPKIILIEDLKFTLVNQNESEVYLFLLNLGYELFAKTVNTLFFKKI